MLKSGCAETLPPLPLQFPQIRLVDAIPLFIGDGPGAYACKLLHCPQGHTCNPVFSIVILILPTIFFHFVPYFPQHINYCSHVHSNMHRFTYYTIVKNQIACQVTRCYNSSDTRSRVIVHLMTNNMHNSIKYRLKGLRYYSKEII